MNFLHRNKVELEDDYVEPTEAGIIIDVPSRIYTPQDERPCDQEINYIIQNRLEEPLPDCHLNGFFKPVQVNNFHFISVNNFLKQTS